MVNLTILLGRSPSTLLQGVTEVVLLLSTLEGEDNKCPFTGPPTGPTHPFVTLLSKRADLAPALIEEAAHLIRHPDQRWDDYWFFIYLFIYLFIYFIFL